MQLPEKINLNENGYYCINCFTIGVERISKSKKTVYYCKNCGQIKERALVIDDLIVSWLDQDRNYWHESVGSLIIDPNGKILCIKRNFYPIAYALPAGHLDQGEEPAKSIQREVLEEIGVNFPQNEFELIAEFELPGDSCRRGSDHHKWHLYKVKTHSNLKIILNDEAKDPIWLSAEEILALGDQAVYPLQFIAKNFAENE